jgi:hypothetical protein
MYNKKQGNEFEEYHPSNDAIAEATSCGPSYCSAAVCC